MFQLLAYIVTEEGRPDMQSLKKATTEQKKLIKDLWATDPKRRPSADEFLVRLSQVFENSTCSSSRPDDHPNDAYDNIQRQFNRMLGKPQLLVDHSLKADPCLGDVNDDSCFTGQGQGGNMGGPQGFGIVRHKSDSRCIFLADWSEGKVQGTGICLWNNTERYFGTWQGGWPHGKGVKRFSNGRVYFGQLENNSMHVFSHLVYPDDGSMYEGWFRANLRHGRGILYDGQGDIIYKGEWRSDAKEERIPCSGSTSTFLPEDHKHRLVYKDPWGVPGHYTGPVNSSGKPHGWGVLVQSGTMREAYYARWHKGKVQDYGLYVWADHCWYLGDWNAMQSHNRGIEVSGGGDLYLGEFDHGKKHGEGMKMQSDWNRLYAGQVQNGIYHGHGKLLTLDGTVLYDGEWRNGAQAV